MTRLGADIRNLLHHIGVAELRYVEMYMDHEAALASLRWGLLAGTDRAYMEAHGHVPRRGAEQPTMAMDAPSLQQAPAHLRLIGSVQRFATVSAAKTGQMHAQQEEVEAPPPTEEAADSLLAQLGLPQHFTKRSA